MCNCNKKYLVLGAVSLWPPLVAQMVKDLLAVQETQVRCLGWEDPLEKETATYSSILAGKSNGQRSLVGYSLWGHKELDTTEQLTLSLIQ